MIIRGCVRVESGELLTEAFEVDDGSTAKYDDRCVTVVDKTPDEVVHGVLFINLDAYDWVEFGTGPYVE